MKKQNLNLNEIWRTCRKVQSAIYRYGYRISDYFKFFDPKQSGLMPESKFRTILGRLKNLIGISEFEIQELSDYFRLSDGRVAYKQFCDVISEDHDLTKNFDFVSGLEWNDPLHVNSLSDFEYRQLCILLTKIAHTVRLRDIVLMPYFQDYELISKNVGTVTIPHFSRVLHFMKIVLSEKDFILLLKRYLKDSYTVNYVAFIKDIEEIVRYFDSHRLIDFSEDIIENFPGRLIDVELPKLPRPEIGTIRTSDVFGKETSFHTALMKRKPTKDAKEIFLRVQRHILENRIRIHEFFGSFDLLNCGFITKNQFLRALDNVGISGLHRLFLTNDELEILCQMYADPNDVDRVNWRQFEREVNEVFTISNLEKRPYEIIICPPTEVVELKRSGQENWQEQKHKIRDLCEETLLKIKNRIQSRRLYLKRFFQDFDKCNLGHVSRSQMRQVLITNGILLSDEEFYALEKRYNDDMGFNYLWFLSEADPKDYIPLKYEDKECPPLEAEDIDKIPPKQHLDIVHVLAKVKRQVVTKRIRIIDFLKDFDRLNNEFMNEYDFRRGVDNANVKLSVEEMDVICDTFKTPFRKGYIDYKIFCKVIEEVSYQENLEKAPLLVPLQHFPSTDCDNCFLNFEERVIVSKALKKLATKPDHISNLSSIFQDFDRQNCGTITNNQFLRALTLRDLKNLISSREFDTICKCFGVERGLHMEVDYRAFTKVLDILFATNQKHPF